MNGGLNVGWKDVYCESNCISTQNVSVFPDIMASDMKGRFIYKVSDDVIIRGGCLPSDDGQLEVSPQYVSAFGGHIVDVSGVCVTNTSKVTCKFGASDPVEAVYASPMFVRCLTPRLTARDLVTLKITIDDSTVLHKDIHAVLPFQSTQLDHIVLSLGWDKTDVRKLNLTWDYKVFSNNPAATVDILLIGYRETETQMIFKILATLGTNVKISDGVFEFDTSDHRCSGEDCKLFEQGMVEVRLNTKYWTPATKYGFIGSGIFPIGWHVVEYMKSTHGADWSKVLCTNWYDTDRQEMTWLEELLDCPCTLDQALTDFGRWLTDGGCNIFNGSVCTYHIGAVHCVRSFKPSKSGAGNQCCYGPDGNVRYAADSFQGSTPDRGHDWGAPPYNKPGYVPSLSHWKHDVVTFYYCCLWVDYKYCDNYMDQRATRDCKNYQPPKTAIIYGGLHVRTFANIAYVAVGIGDYWLTKTTDFQLQGRFDQIKGTLVFSTALVGVVLQGTNSSKVEIQLAPSTYTSQRVLTILVDQQITWFNTLERSRQDLKGLTIINYESQAGKHDNFTIIMTNGIGVQVVAVNNLLHTTVVVPQAYKDQTEGLLGTWSDIEMDGVKNRNGQLIPIQTSSTQHIYENLITSWSVNATERLFQYPTMQNPSFAPLFSFPLLPINITEDEINELCGSEMPNSSCHYDYRATGSSDIANATLQAETWFKTVQSFQVPVESCGLLDVPRSIKNSYNYGIGSKINIDGCRKGYLTGETTSYMCTRKGNNTNVWEPEISAMCKAPTQPPPCPSGPTGAGSSPKITSILAIFIFMCYLVSYTTGSSFFL
ncbi:hypothetical protein SNE40_011254 [Patella caerulea]|uniref:Uncharacterized protein n=1 Tax=Patella caerulea TaxID=87958 RepID=A0AAN8PLC0_PATCE